MPPGQRDFFSFSTPATGYLGALAALLLALGARYVLTPWIGMMAPFLTIFPALAFTVWCFGARPALLNLLLSFAAVQFFFIPGQFSVNQENLVLLATYLVSGGLIVLLGLRLRRRTREAAALAVELEEREARNHAARRTHNEELRSVQRQLQVVLDNVPALIYQIDTADRHAYVNKAGWSC